MHTHTHTHTRRLSCTRVHARTHTHSHQLSFSWVPGKCQEEGKLVGSGVGRRPHPTPPHPTPPHARSAAGMPGRLLRVQGPGSRKPRGPPGRARRVLAGGGGVRGAERRRPATRPPGLRSRVVQLKCSARSVESCGRLGRAAGRSERQAQRRALRAPGGSRPRLRPYHPERARSRLISEAKQGRAWLVLGWETAWEYRVL